jgi:2-polyprenyl-6-methoxyphenol hydroxylase-like FAD-dependent oxidoreductase
VLRRAGILDVVRERGFTIRDMSWRKLGGDPIVEIKDMDKIDHPDRMVIYPLNLLSELIMEEISKLSCATVRFQHKVVGVGQTEGGAWVKTESEDGTTNTLEADFVVGCDGASSGVRKALFGKNFPGKTWDQQIVTTNVRGHVGFPPH